MNLKQCEAECLKNCTCRAYTDSKLTGRDSGCLMWFGDLIDMRKKLHRAVSLHTSTCSGTRYNYFRSNCLIDSAKVLFGGYTSTRPTMMSRCLIAGFHEQEYSAEV
ncbi:hypothetical protein WN944_001788 [Citrus x changshan-huyou]|uniref:Apple domain-containing protein n=1 Tax=Citrus x changshan-huyou TaxID=2935761 RepID=A0AAP0MFB4_9ROSI